MAKQSGLGDALWVDGVDLSGDIGSLSEIGGGNSPLVVTGIDKLGFERLGGKLDGRINFSAWFNDATGPPAQEHQTLKTRPTTDRIVSYVRGVALGAESASFAAKQINYDPTRGDDGSLSFAVEAQANGFGLTWGKLATSGKRTDVAPTNGAGIDNGASTAFGLRAWAHCFAFTGTSITIAIQESSDNGAGDPYSTILGGLGVFAFSGVAAGVLAPNTAITVERWLRIATSGTFTSATFAVIIERFATATVPQ